MSTTPADRMLELLRELGPDAYRCTDQPGRWIARCPVCGERRLDVTEHGPGGQVRLRCWTGCDADHILHKLTRPDRCHACGNVHGQTAQLAHAATEVVNIAHAALELARQRDGHHIEAIAA